MKLTIIVGDNRVVIDGEVVDGVDLSWIPEFVGESGISTSVHALQWYNDHGEIELKSNDPNIPITELGIFSKSIEKFEERKQEIVNETPEIGYTEEFMDQLIEQYLSESIYIYE